MTSSLFLSIGSTLTKLDAENPTQIFTKKRYRQQEQKRKAPSLSMTSLKTWKPQEYQDGEPFTCPREPIYQTLYAPLKSLESIRPTHH
jgi:hypothetical protein